MITPEQITAGLARYAARTIHAYRAEQRRLDTPPAPPVTAPVTTELSCTGARVESAWRPTHREPAAARGFGFTADPQ